jgi:pyruvate/2-oxoglutarate dehydrogenase complex dihydrolipoamide dehydrogenase (E3) component
VKSWQPCSNVGCLHQKTLTQRHESLEQLTNTTTQLGQLINLDALVAKQLLL